MSEMKLCNDCECGPCYADRILPCSESNWQPCTDKVIVDAAEFERLRSVEPKSCEGCQDYYSLLNAIANGDYCLGKECGCDDPKICLDCIVKTLGDYLDSVDEQKKITPKPEAQEKSCEGCILDDGECIPPVACDFFTPEAQEATLLQQQIDDLSERLDKLEKQGGE